LKGKVLINHTEEEPVVTKKPVKYLRLVYNLGKSKKKVFIVFALLSIVFAGMQLIAQNMPRLIVDLAEGLEGSPTGEDMQRFFVYAGLYFGLMLLLILGRVLQRINVEKASISIVSDLKVRMFSHLTKARLQFFHRNPVGRLLTRVEADTERLRLVFRFLMVTVFGDATQSVAAFVFMFIYDFSLAIWLMIPVGFIFLTSFIYQKVARPRLVRLRKKISEITGYIAESISGIRTIQAFKNEEDFKSRFEDEVEYRRREELKVFAMLLVYFRSAFMFQRFAAWIVVFVFALLTQGQTGASIGTLVMFTTLVNIAVMPLRVISEQIGMIQEAFASLERIDGIMHLKREDSKELYTLVKEQEDLVERNKELQKVISETKSIKHGIEFDNVWFTYKYESESGEDKSTNIDLSTEDEEDWVLKGISFKLKAGRSLALIGPTGCGKTTIIKLLFRFYEPQKGRILLDGKDIRDYPIHELRAYMGLVQQENHLFTGTIEDNITLDNPNISRDKIVEASKQVGSDSFIEKRQGGYDAEVTEKGGNYSSGEKQLVAFTRCMVYDRPILILDEATSNIDANSERLIQQTILNMLESNKTSIMIAHRLSTIRHSDQIIVMDKGRILERGNHEQLIAKDGRYKQYFQYQFSENVG
jgi:ATP-binding cassette subfamily B protein